MLVSILYNTILWLGALIAFPKILYGYWVKKKYRQSLGKRFGFKFPIIKKENRFLIWVHAVSVGETKAVAALIKVLKAELKDPLIVVSSITETGHAEARRSIPAADYHVYLPFDISFIIGPIVKHVSPDLVIISETDFWYNFLKFSKQLRAKVVITNGKISARSLERFQKFHFFSSRLFSLFDLTCVQSQHYVKRFEQIGVADDKIVVTGNLKFDDEYPRLSQEHENTWRRQLGINAGDRVIVIGSTHDPEESLLIHALKPVWEKYPHLKVMIVPRHPERFNAVADLLDKEKISYVRFTEQNSSHEERKVILMDAMGLLRKCYQLADVAIVAGSYTPKVGGHNILEPSWYGVPVVFGPFMHTQPELLELAKEYGAGIQVPIEKVTETVMHLLDDEEERLRIGRNGLRMLGEINGATRKTWESLKKIIPSSVLSKAL